MSHKPSRLLCRGACLPHLESRLRAAAGRRPRRQRRVLVAIDVAVDLDVSPVVAGHPQGRPVVVVLIRLQMTIGGEPAFDLADVLAGVAQQQLGVGRRAGRQLMAAWQHALLLHNTQKNLASANILISRADSNVKGHICDLIRATFEGAGRLNQRWQPLTAPHWPQSNAVQVVKPIVINIAIQNIVQYITNLYCSKSS